MWHKAAEPYVSTNRNHYNRRADPAAACDDSKWVESLWPADHRRRSNTVSMDQWADGWMGEQTNR